MIGDFFTHEDPSSRLASRSNTRPCAGRTWRRPRASPILRAAGSRNVPETVPCGKNSAAPVRARTRALTRVRGAAPSPTAIVKPRRLFATSRSPAGGKTSSRRRAGVGGGSSPFRYSTTLYPLLVSRPSTTGPGPALSVQVRRGRGARVVSVTPQTRRELARTAGARRRGERLSRPAPSFPSPPRHRRAAPRGELPQRLRRDVPVRGLHGVVRGPIRGRGRRHERQRIARDARASVSSPSSPFSFSFATPASARRSARDAARSLGAARFAPSFSLLFQSRRRPRGCPRTRRGTHTPRLPGRCPG